MRFIKSENTATDAPVGIGSHDAGYSKPSDDTVDSPSPDKERDPKTYKTLKLKNTKEQE